jgi:hypothetical protein
MSDARDPAGFSFPWKVRSASLDSALDLFLRRLAAGKNDAKN